ncbi:MAG: hypothetical protein OEN22_04770 [Gammaproteobacteria bacterium]|nr:hypothetical protein [Gammaproteobacteria bacterium]
MANALRYTLQVAAYAAFALMTGYFSFWPRYDYASPEAAVVKVSLSHAADRTEPCVRLSPQEIAALAPNMRQELKCERRRLPLILELDVDGQQTLRLQAQPSGVWEDGPASIYERFDVPAGSHRIVARLRDSARADGWDYTYTEDVVLEPGRYLTITFREETGGFSTR